MTALKIQLHRRYASRDLDVVLWTQDGKPGQDGVENWVGFVKSVTFEVDRYHDKADVAIRRDPTLQATPAELIELHRDLGEELRALGLIRAEPTVDELRYLKIQNDFLKAHVASLMGLLRDAVLAPGKNSLLPAALEATAPPEGAARKESVPFIYTDGAKLVPTLFLRQGPVWIEQWCQPFGSKDGSARWVPLANEPRIGHAEVDPKEPVVKRVTDGEPSRARCIGTVGPDGAQCMQLGVTAFNGAWLCQAHLAEEAKRHVAPKRYTENQELDRACEGRTQELKELKFKLDHPTAPPVCSVPACHGEPIAWDPVQRDYGEGKPRALCQSHFAARKAELAKGSTADPR